MSDGPVPLTLHLARALALSDRSGLPEPVAARARIAFLDTLAVISAGLGDPAVGPLAASVTGHTARDRALVLGTAAHALDYDDVAFGGHVSAVIVPAVLALLPEMPLDTPSQAVLLAYAAGYEAWAEVASRESTLYHAKGGHPTGLLGPIGAAAAAASLLQLRPVAYAHALGIAASLGAGLTVNFGTMTKPFHAGRAAEARVFAALLAREGMTAAPDALEAANGFLRVHSPRGEVDLARPLFLQGGTFRLEAVGPSVKRYPVCYAAHRAIDAALLLHTAGGFDADDLERIEILISPRHSGTLRYRLPTTVAEARFSLEFAVGTALLTGKVGLRQLTEDWLADTRLRRLMAVCQRRLSDDPDPALEGFAAFDQVTVYAHGRPKVQSPPVTRALGHADRPMNPEGIEAKLVDCLGLTRGLPPAARVRDLVAELGRPGGRTAALAGLAEDLFSTALASRPR